MTFGNHLNVSRLSHLRLLKTIQKVTKIPPYLKTSRNEVVKDDCSESHKNVYRSRSRDLV